ncbi:TetR/AcrR family transcriptional regulator [uncultured Reyranella sp.]|uniref:TetR/AcrR family transcriptional regulator n=1 Tax=uncultured Reyranella sp. TaxID=735512 RepID=UPI0025FC57D2|nr:TetR/AcrR family transcriptional regulator [uncultured Reyranella sp.]
MARKTITKKPNAAAPRRRKADRPNLSERILDVAEELFGRVGYGGATTRAIASRARVNVGQLHYYFESKRAIFEAVVARHGKEVTERRRQLLQEAQARHPRGIVPLEVLVDALVRPLLMAEPRAGGRRTSMQMHARLFTDPDDTASMVRADIYDETNALYVDAIRRALPKIPAKTLYWRYYFMMGAYVWTLLQPGRLEAISQGSCDPADMEAAIREIVPFVCAGLAAPAGR